jgi:DNA replicative helicase MCM subunit Mcm2 (Cdc46/Mcm family)
VTTQTKQYIELSDLLALRYECKECQTSVTVPIKGFDTVPVTHCPKCRKGWTIVDNTSYKEDIEYFVTSAVRLKDVLRAMGFNLSIEVKQQS